MRHKLSTLILASVLCIGTVNVFAYDGEIDLDSEDANIEISEPGNTLIYSESGSTSSKAIIVSGDLGEVSITLKDISIKTTDSDVSALLVGEGTTLNLNLEGENKLESQGGCGIEVKGAIVIDGTGSLTAIARGWGDAGIGTLNGNKLGDITINGGTISATGNSEACGIGGGNGAKIAGNITINGGIVTARGGSYAAGIGSGYTCVNQGGGIFINGGTITAQAGGNSVGGSDGSGAIGCGWVSGPSYIINKIVITGGSIKTLSNGGTFKANGITPAPTNAAEEPVNVVLVQHQVTGITGSEYVSGGYVGDIILGDYGIKDTKTDDNGKVYFYLPEAYLSEEIVVETSPDNPFDSFAEIDLATFRTLIDNAKTKFNGATVGELVGEYYQSKLDEFETAIDKALTVSAQGVARQKDQDALEAAMTAFDEAKNAEAQDIALVLSDAVTSAKALLSKSDIGDGPGQYPTSAKTAFEGVITTAENADPATRTILDQLTQARATFLSKLTPVSLTALQATIATAKEKINGKETGSFNGQYPEGAIDAFQKAIASAESLVAFPPSKQETIDNMDETLKAAITTFEGLEIKIEFGDLSTLVSSAEEYANSITATAGSNLETTLNAFKSVIATAKEAVNSSTVSQEDVNTQITTLTNTIKTFVGALKSEEGLNNILINTATAYAGNTPVEVAEFKPFVDALTELIESAETLNGSEDITVVTQSALKSVVEGINTNITGLVALMSADLQALVDEADIIYAAMVVGEDPGQYTKAEKAAINSAINSAKLKLAPASKTQYDYFVAEVEILTATLNSILSKELQTIVTKATAKHDNAVEGTAIGEFQTGSKAELKTAIDAANDALEGTDAGFIAYYKDACDALNAAYEAFLKKENGADKLNDLSGNGIVVFANNGKLQINGLNAEVMVMVYNMNGGKVFGETVSASEYSRELPAGNYVVAIQGYVNGSCIVIIK